MFIVFIVAISSSSGTCNKPTKYHKNAFDSPVEILSANNALSLYQYYNIKAIWMIFSLHIKLQFHRLFDTALLDSGHSCKGIRNHQPENNPIIVWVFTMVMYADMVWPRIYDNESMITATRPLTLRLSCFYEVFGTDKGLKQEERVEKKLAVSVLYIS